jgi:chlorite dismutase
MSALAAGAPLFVSFLAGDAGEWAIESLRPVIGDGLDTAERLQLVETPTLAAVMGTSWTLRGVTSNTRYTTQAEAKMLRMRQEGLGRPQATCAALIPIRKSAAWWAMAQDERRAIFEEQSHHIAVGAEYLPAIARRLHHSRELGEPFDFLTWFEYAPEDSDAFETMVKRLRSSPEWQYVEREVDVRLRRSA